MLKKKLGVKAIEKDWPDGNLKDYFKIPPTLIIPEGCKWIGGWVFMDCLGLKKVVIPESVDWIENFAFWDCKKATIILKKHKNEFKGIGKTSFLGCKNVKVC